MQQIRFIVKITGMTDSTGSTSYAYYSTGSTGGGKLETEEGPLGSTAASTYGYDNLSRPVSTSINGTGSSLGYDSLGRVISPTNPLGTFTYSYDGATTRLLSSALSGSGQVSTSYTYGDIDHDFRLSEIKNLNGSSGVISQNDYTYNPVGTLASWQQQTDSGTTNTIWNYAYDNADQLLSGTKTIFNSPYTVQAKYAYGYDLAGNRTSAQNGTSVTQTAFNNLNQIQTASSGGPTQFSGTLNEPVKQVTVQANSGPSHLAQKREKVTGIFSV
jgi:hypothetical protein